MSKFKIYTRGIVFNSSDEVLLIKKQNDQEIAGGEWLLPGGTVEYEENVEQTLVRELKEETNLETKSLNLITTKKMMIGESHWLGVYYRVRVKDEKKLKNREPEKHERVDFYELDNIPEFKDYNVVKFVNNVENKKEFFEINTPTKENHAMEDALERYTRKKIHHEIKENNNQISSIKIIGNHDRSTKVYKDEKRDKKFNHQRPTCFLEEDNLYLCCFPGKDYVYHYAKLVKYYTELENLDITVSYLPPSDQAVKKEFLSTNITEIPDADVVIFGNIDRIGLFENKEFKGKGDFEWKKGVINNKEVLLLGCKFSIWGDNGYQLIKNLDSVCNFSTFIYTGKLGVLNSDIKPNKYLATGDSSIVNKGEIEWNNLFDQQPNQKENILQGKHFTCRSVMDETKDKINSIKEKVSFIDPEIGNMAKAAQEFDKNFSYLHVISDNVINHQRENLSNERTRNIREKRDKLFNEIGEIIRQEI
ncbi:MAG: NUDIX hydrolase [Candidatus Magasanikbacteria bacterium]